MNVSNRFKINLLFAFVLSSVIGTANFLRQDSCVLKHFRPPNETSLFLFAAGYKLPVNKASIINSGHGLYIEAGINTARFFSTKTIFGIYGGWAMMDRLWSTSFNSAFVADYRAAYNQDAGLNSLDSAVASSFAGIISANSGRSPTAPGCQMKSFHNYSLYYGISLKLPYRFSPILKLYAGFTRSHFQGGDIITSKRDYNIFQLRRSMYGAELILFRGRQSVSGSSDKIPSHLNTGAISLYYECSDLSNGSLYFDDGVNHSIIPVKKISSASFLSKYSREAYFGPKLSFCIL